MLKPSLKYHSSTGYVRNTNGNNNNENSKHNNDGGKPKKKSSSKRPPAALDLTLISNYSTNGNEVSMDNGNDGRRPSSTHSLPTSPLAVSPFRRSEEFKKRSQNSRHLSCPFSTTTTTSVITSSIRIEKYNVRKSQSDATQNLPTRRLNRFSQVITGGSKKSLSPLTSSSTTSSSSSSTTSCSKFFERFPADRIASRSPILPDTDEVRILF